VNDAVSLRSLLLDVGGHCTNDLFSDAVTCEVGNIDCAELQERLSRALESKGLRGIVESNFVEFGCGTLRSGTAAGLSLHQEGYESRCPPQLLFLYCVESDHSSGNTTVASTLALLGPRYRKAVDNTCIRFFRTSTGLWTPWRPILQEDDRGPSVRFAFPDVHRTVASRGAIPCDVIADEIAKSQLRVEWKPGLLLAVNNLLTLHGRDPFMGTARRLFRLTN